ncbi:MAG: sulfotransferase [Leptolyngbya sp. SIOISBB]|nr:sulfotransferase [Leptolyngbya sp. SIOISBB]
MSPTPLPYRWNLQGNYCMGITLANWRSLLHRQHHRVDPAYWHRAAVITLTSLLSTALSQVESWRYDSAIAATELPEDPIFILGHWRSGTTLLHELMTLDVENLAYPNTFEVMSPTTFLLTEDWCSRWFASLVPTQRPMDNMRLSFQSPQEDEFAIALTTLQSYYLALSFPAAESAYEQYLTLEDLSAEALQTWQIHFRWFLKKLTYKYQRPLVLKSPPHTARIRLLLEMFPKARFIHIHRHPYDVFRSMRRYYHTAGWLTCLQKPNLATLDQAILRRYRLLYDAYFEQRSLIPTEQFHEMAFTDLEQAPVTQLQALYQQLQLPYSNAFEARVDNYLNARRHYRKNQFAPLEDNICQHINQQWQRSFAMWGYSSTNKIR